MNEFSQNNYEFTEAETPPAPAQEQPRRILDARYLLDQIQEKSVRAQSDVRHKLLVQNGLPEKPDN